MYCMKNLDKIFIIIFVVVSALFLWLISPMGQLYLPLDKSKLEGDLQFKLNPSFELKGIDNYNDYVIYHLRVDEKFPHIISIVVQPEADLEIDQVQNAGSPNYPISRFWASTTFQDVNNKGCKEVLINSRKLNLCDFTARWPIINNDNFKDGQYTLVNKDGKTVFVFSSSSKGEYDQKNIVKLLKNVVK
ncbi:MAG: hypothetical protein AB7V50_11625 [Vampirovibrionia bacterium]